MSFEFDNSPSSTRIPDKDCAFLFVNNPSSSVACLS